MKRAWKIAVVAWGAAEVLCFGGLVFGWASMVYVLKLEDYFLCSNGQQNLTSTRTPDIYTVLNYTRTDNTHQIEYTNSTHQYKYIIQGHEKPTENPVSVPCPSQDAHFNLVYVIATVFTGVTNVMSGWLMDKFGIRFCRCLGIITYVLGTLLIAFSTPALGLLLYPGLLLLCYGGYFILMTNMQLSRLIREKGSTIISLYCGAYDSSAFILILVKWAFEAGIPIRWSFLFLTGAFSFCVFSTFFFLPKGNIPQPLPEGYTLPLCGRNRSKKSGNIVKVDETEKEMLKDVGQYDSVKEMEMVPLQEPGKISLNGVNSTTVTNESSKLETHQKNGSPSDGQTGGNEEPPTLKESVLSALYILDVVWLTCHRFRSWSYVGMLNPSLTRLARGNKAIVSKYTSVYASLQFLGIFLAPLSGRLMDRKKKVPAEAAHIAKVEMCVLSFLLNTTVGVLLTVMTCIPVIEVQYASFALHVVHRAFLYGPNTAFIAKAFQPQHFGRLFGLAMSVAAVVSLLQYPMFLLVQGAFQGDPLPANLVILIVLLLSYIHPFYIWYWCRKQTNMLTAAKD